MLERVTYLLEQRLKQKLTDQEAEELLAILQQPEHETLITNILSEMVQAEPERDELEPGSLRYLTNSIFLLDKKPLSSSRPAHRVYFLKTVWARYAAAILLLCLIGGGMYYFNSRSRQKPVAQLPSVTRQPDIAPGGMVATLTLSDGTQIALDSAADGALARQGNTDVIKLQKGQLGYKTIANSRPQAAGEAAYNTISTPRGGQYQVTLPDGSKVWLNAASSIRFPTVFTGRSREVAITGEAYFEIAANAKSPFYVKTGGMAVEVLGTKFNVNAYTDEASIKTTLLEGSVRIRKVKIAAMLAPGQQASLDPKGSISINKNADVDEAVAWKNGLFHMTSADVPAIMRQLARWYDVEVAFEGGMPAGHITGEVPRNVSLSTVLKVFEISGVHFRIEGKKIIVTQ